MEPNPKHVSIRARLWGRAMRSILIAGCTPWLFQSAPGFGAGRCAAPGRQSADSCRFNPRPALGPGDAVIDDRLAGQVDVSIRARLWGRAMPVDCRPWLAATLFQSAPGFGAGRCVSAPVKRCRRSKFQSAPGFGAGRCLRRDCHRPAGQEVSIRARLWGRAMPEVAVRPDIYRIVSIRARLWGRAMRAPSPATHPRVYRFNPRPALGPGDALQRFDGGAGGHRFNPRPALGPGDAQIHYVLRRVQIVSIRARLWGRAMRRRSRSGRTAACVSIRARLWGRAMRRV